MALGEEIRTIRKAHGLTQQELADKAGLAVNTIRLYEAEKRVPDVVRLKKIADALGCSVNEFYPGSNDAESMIDSLISNFHLGDPDNRLELKLTITPTTRIWGEDRLCAVYKQLNDKGKEIAIERLEELALIPAYQKQPSESEDTQNIDAQPSDTPSDK